MIGMYYDDPKRLVYLFILSGELFLIFIINWNWNFIIYPSPMMFFIYLLIYNFIKLKYLLYLIQTWKNVDKKILFKELIFLEFVNHMKMLRHLNS